MSSTVNPTRMELMKLRKKYDTTKRGHKLLKDKQDELIHQFINLLNDYKELRNKVEHQIISVLNDYKKTSIKMNQEDITNVLSKYQSNNEVIFSNMKMMGISLPKIDISFQSDDENYDYYNTTSHFDKLLANSQKLAQPIMELIQTEAQIEILISEIETSKRRVNAIDNIILKEIEEQIYDIKMKLSDMELSNTVRMMKSKEIILNKIKRSDDNVKN